MPNEIEITVKGRDQGAQRTISETGRSVQRVGEIAQGIIAAQLFRQIGQAASEFLGQARDASSNLGESINAVNVVFKGTSEGIHSIGETSASAMGLSQNAFNAAAVRFSNFAKVVAGPGGDAAATIRDITQRSADFASVLNLDVTKGMELFQSGLAGETEPLRRYGIDVSAAAVKTFAYANGIAAAGAELTEAEKIQARYGLIMQQTEAMAGDFANTSDSLANSQRILNAEFENAQAIVGNLMVPGLQAMNAILIPLVQTFNDAPRPVQLVIGGLVLLAAGAIQVTSAMAPMLISMNAAGISAGGLATRARAAALSMTSLGLAVAAAGVGVIAWGSSARHTSEDVAGLTEDVDRFVRTGQQTASLKRHFGEGAEGVAEFADKLDVATAGFFSWSNNLNRSFDEISKAKSAFKDLDTAMADLVDRGADSDEVMRRLVETYDLSAGQVEELRGLLPKYSEAAQRATERTGDLAGAQEGAATATGAHAASVQELADTLRAQTDPVFAFTRAQQDLAAAQDAVTEAVKDHGKKSPEYRRALQDEAEAALDVLEAAGKLGDEFTGDLSDAQRQMLRDAGLSEAGVAELERMMRIAKRRAEELDGTRIRIYELYQRTIRTINENITRNFGPSAPQVFAHGGITGAQGGGPRGGQVLVGEQGPELVDLAPGSMVHTAGATQALLGGGRGPVEIVFRIETGGHELDEAVRASMLRTLRNDPGFRADVKVSVVGNGR